MQGLPYAMALAESLRLVGRMKLTCVGLMSSPVRYYLSCGVGSLCWAGSSEEGTRVDKTKRLICQSHENPLSKAK